MKANVEKRTRRQAHDPHLSRARSSARTRTCSSRRAPARTSPCWSTAAASRRSSRNSASWARPYLVDNFDQVLRLTRSPLFKGWVDKLRNAANLQVLSFDWFQGHRHVLTNTPVKVPADLKGIRMRTPGAPVWLETVRAMGATPTGMPWSEVYSALQTKVIDGAEAQHPAVYGARLYEVVKIVTKTEHIYLITGIVTSAHVVRQAAGRPAGGPDRGVVRRRQVGVGSDDRRRSPTTRRSCARRAMIGRRDRQGAVQGRDRRRVPDARLHRPARRSRTRRSASNAARCRREVAPGSRMERVARARGEDSLARACLAGCAALVFVAAVEPRVRPPDPVGDRYRDAAVHLVRVPGRRRGAARAASTSSSTSSCGCFRRRCSARC